MPMRRSPANRSAPAVGVGPDPGDDRPDGAPRDAHQLRHRALRAHRGQPRHRLIEAQRVPGAMPRPRHRRDHHTVHRAGHPRRVGLDHRPHRAQIQRPPPPPSLARVVAADSAAGTLRSAAAGPGPAGPRHDHTLVLVELDSLNDRLLDAEQPSP